MTLDDIYYFSIKKIQHPRLFNSVQEIVLQSQKNKSDSDEITRRMAVLNFSKGNEHVRQCSNFVAEVGAYGDLVELGHKPHWVPELNIRMPDMHVDNHPVEVKHLNSPRVEHEALSNSGTFGGDVNTQYHQGLGKKVTDFVNGAKKKFISYNKYTKGEEIIEGTLYLYFSKSVDAMIVDGIEWEKKMEDRIKEIVDPLIKDDARMTVNIRDIDSLFTQSSENSK